MLRLISVLVLILTIGVGQMWGANVTWEQVAWGDITTSDVIIVTVTTSNGTYLLEHSHGTSETPKLGNTGTLGSSNTTCTFSENDNVKWKKDASSRLCKASDGTKWLYTGTSNNAMRVGTSTSGNIWSLDGDYIKSNTSSARYLSVYSTTDFRSYTSKQSGQVTRFYKASSCSNQITITNNATTNVDHGSFTVNKTGAQSSCSALSVVVTPTAATHYHVATVSATNPATTGTAGAAVDNKDGTYTITYSANAQGNTTISVTFAEDPAASISFENAGTPAPTTSGYYVGDSYTLPSSNNYSCSGGKTFVGWSTVEVASQDTKPSSNFHEPGSSVTLGASQTFYAVFATATGSDPIPATESFTYSSHTGWTFGGNTSDETSYYKLHSESGNKGYVESPTISDLSTITSVVVHAGFFGGAAYGSFEVYGGNTKYGDEQSPASKNDNEFTLNPSPNPLSGSGKIKIINTGNDNTDNGTRLFSVTVNYTTGGVSYSEYSTDCCDPLGQINGSFF